MPKPKSANTNLMYSNVLKILKAHSPLRTSIIANKLGVKSEYLSGVLFSMRRVGAVASIPAGTSNRLMWEPGEHAAQYLIEVKEEPKSSAWYKDFPFLPQYQEGPAGKMVLRDKVYAPSSGGQGCVRRVGISCKNSMEEV